MHYLIPDCGLWRHWLATRSLEACRKVQPRAQPVSGSGFRSPSSLPPNTKSKRTLVDNVPGEQLLPNAIPLTPPPPSPTTVPLTAAQLLPKLRWANIGRSYHWGSKSYDFTKTLAQFPQDVRDICQRAVKSVPWNEVWGASSTPAPDTPAEDWGSEGPDSWRSWSDTYGEDMAHEVMDNHFLPDDPCVSQNRTPVLSTFTRPRLMTPSYSYLPLPGTNKPPSLLSGHTHGPRRSLRSVVNDPARVHLVSVSPDSGQGPRHDQFRQLD